MTLLKTSSESFPASKKMMSDIPYVLRVGFRDLARDVKKIIGKPIACHKCGGFLLSVDQIEDDPKVGKHFVCAFCGTLNVIEGEVIVAGYDTDFIVTPPPDKTETTTDMMAAGGRSFLALIDVSGSMAGANLAAVKRSLNTSIDSLAANSPDTLFGLIEFESTVLSRNMETGEAIELPVNSFHSLDMIMDNAKKLLDRIKMVPVGKNSAKLKKHVKALRDQGGTALGPAVGMAYVLAKHRVTPASKYYESLGQMYRELGTALDVVGIASSSGMELKTLGLLPEATGGQMYYVKPNELDRSLSDLAGASLLGRDVEVKLITPLGIKIKDASGVSRAVIEDFRKRSEGKIGVVGENHELYFQIEPDGELKVEEIPVQVQVTYTDEEGARRVRAVTTKLKVTKKEAELFETLDPTVGATFVTQKAGEDAFRGDRARGKSRITTFRSALRKRAGAAPKAVQSKLNMVESALASEEAEMERQEIKMKAVSEAAPSAAADEVSTMNLAQMKRSSKDLFEDEE
jgi:hypothetical protein